MDIKSSLGNGNGSSISAFGCEVYNGTVVTTNEQTQKAEEVYKYGIAMARSYNITTILSFKVKSHKDTVFVMNHINNNQKVLLKY